MDPKKYCIPIPLPRGARSRSISTPTPSQMPYRSRSRSRSSYRKRSAFHQTAVQIPLAGVVAAYTQTNSIVVPAMTVGEGVRTISNLKINMVIDQYVTGTGVNVNPTNFGYTVQYVPSGANPQTAAFNQAQSGTLVAANQFVLAAGTIQSGNTDNTIWARGCRLNDGDEIHFCIQPIQTIPATETAVI